GITASTITVITSNILVCYDSDLLTQDEVVGLVEQAISLHSLKVFKEERLKKNASIVQERSIQEEPISEIVTRVAASGVTLVFTALKRRRLGIAGVVGSSFIKRLTSIPAMTSLTLAWPILKNGISSLVRDKRPNADTLSSTAIVSSLLAGRDLSALIIILLAESAELLTAYSMKRTRRAIRDLLSVGEDQVWKIAEDGTHVRAPIHEIAIDDTIIVHTGEKISVDGEISHGVASIDQSPITGEFMPANKKLGDEVFAGTVVKNGLIFVRAQKVGDETAVSRIFHLVEEASHRKAQIQAYADKFSTRFIPVNFALAMIVYLATRSPTRALNMLIIDYSCGVRLSTATALSGTIAAAARQGVLVKGGNYIEQLVSCDTLILDKTGTVTEGRPIVTTVAPTDPDTTPRMLMEYAAAAEETATHPMAMAILSHVRKSGWQIPKHGDTNIATGMGVETTIGKHRVRVGNRRYMSEHGIDVTPAHETVSRIAQRGESSIYIASTSKIKGIVGIQDTLKGNMKKALNRIRKTSIDDVILLTGDVEQQAEVVAARILADAFHAEVLPENKSEVVMQLQSKGVRVIMVGDGINDAPALAYADVGIAMGGTRTDIAMEAADITISRDDPLLLPGVIGMATRCMSIIKQNFAASIGINSAGLLLASFGVLPVFWGAVLHNATTIAVVANSARMLFFDIEEGK
ncbi:MAG: heavy metal translocating P-type ATPase, partial [Spirochaetales bacterium]|nr:heavy metal translocating P-type ATPase [Spirochaetales bacterium]